jgi:hypothetical protein
VRSPARIDAVKYRDAATATRDALTDFIEDTGFMHGFLTFEMMRFRSCQFRSLRLPV